MADSLALGSASSGRTALQRAWHPLAVAACMIAIAFALDWLFRPHEILMGAARTGRDRIYAGEFLSLRPIELMAFALAVGRLFLPPLMMLAALRLVETLARPKRDRRSHKAIWQAQILFVTVTSTFNYLALKVGVFPEQALITIPRGEGFLEALFWSLPMYLAAVFLVDFMAYWFHRALHAVPILWKFHAVHHSPQDLDVLYDVIHPVEQLLKFPLLILPAACIVSIDASQLYVLTTIMTLHNSYVHMNTSAHLGPFRHLIADNRYHFLHHSRARADWDKNFATVFPVLDRLFGTYRRPPDRLCETGIPGAGQPTRVSHYLLASWPPEDNATK